MWSEPGGPGALRFALKARETHEYLLSAAEPLDYIRENWLDVPRFLAAGVIVAAFTTTLPLAVAGFTTRRAFAAAFVIGLFIISAAVGGIMTECEDHREGPPSGRPATEDCEPLTRGAAKWVGLVDIGRVPTHVSDMIFGVENNSQLGKQVQLLPDIVPIGWYLLLVAGPGLLLWRRYRRIEP